MNKRGGEKKLSFRRLFDLKSQAATITLKLKKIDLF